MFEMFLSIRFVEFAAMHGTIRTHRPGDLNRLAKRLVDMATGAIQRDPEPGAAAEE
jgi:hypothetical protein